MYTVTLLTSPDAPTLEPALVDSVRNAWGGGDAVWLAPDEAAAFEIPTRPTNQGELWHTLQAMSVDLVVQPSEGRQKKILLADMDSTLIHQECIDELAAEAGVGPEVSQITARAMNGEIDFEEALHARVAALKGQAVSIIDQVLQDRITYVPGGRNLVATMKAHGGYCALVSGGFTQFSRAVAAHLGFDEHRANRLLTTGAVLSGTVALPVLGKDAKVRALKEICATLNLGAGDVIAVGDGANDLGMLGVAGTGVALHAKPSVAQQCDVRINFGDLTALLYVQGYAKENFVL